MELLKEKYIVDSNGNPIEIILPIDYYKQLIEEIEETEELKAYDKAKSEGDEFVDFDSAMLKLGL
jgi:hypothetical protein